MSYKSQVAALARWAVARHAIHVNREAGKPKPWTDDPILQSYRFCNVYRELDRETVWIRQNVREPYANEPHLWWLLMLCRRINWNPTLSEIITMAGRNPQLRGAWPVGVYGYEPKALQAILDVLKKMGLKIHSAAYMISAKKGDTNKNKTTAYACLQKPWKRRDEITAAIRAEPTLANAYDQIFNSGGFGWGSFMAAQVVADLKHTPILAGAVDRETWAASGPGSRRGLNRVLGRDKDAPWREEDWYGELTRLRDAVRPHLEGAFMTMVDAQDLQNCLCEFDKYSRVAEGHRPKVGYAGRA